MDTLVSVLEFVSLDESVQDSVLEARWPVEGALEIASPDEETLANMFEIESLDENELDDVL